MPVKNVDNEVVIFCESYPQIKNALYLTSQHYSDHPVTIVIIGYHDLYRFFKVINKKVFNNSVNIVYFDVYPARMAQNYNRFIKVLYLLPDIVRERRYLQKIFNKYFAQLASADVYFLDRCFNPSKFYFLKKLCETNRIIYMPDASYDVLQVLKSFPRNLSELVILVSYKLIYGHDLTLSKYPYMRCVPTIPDKFIKQHVDRIIKKEERNLMLQSLNMDTFKVFDTDIYSVLYLDENPIGAGYIADAETYKKILADVFSLLGRYFPENSIARKYHPNYKGDRNLIKTGVILPDYIPAEFLYNEKIKLYIGIYSFALANVTQGLAVSLINMVPFKNDIIKEQIKGELIQWSHTDILFPKSLEEFEGILSNIKRQAV